MSFDAMSEDQLLDHLYREAATRGCCSGFGWSRTDKMREHALYLSYDPLGIGTERIAWSGDGPEQTGPRSGNSPRALERAG